MVEDIFPRIIAALDRSGTPYMLTGSFASAYHGAARGTQDIDLVIAPTAQQLGLLIDQFPEGDYYVDRPAALEALRQETQFNVIDFATGWKVDLIVRKSRAFSREEFERRFTVDLGGQRLVITTAEDVLIAKLEWAKLRGSRRQLEDAAGILRIRRDDLDRAYLGSWVRRLQLQDEWEAACGLAGVTT